MRTVFRVQAIGLLAAAALIAPLGGTASAADGCLSGPNSVSPAGSHWYYRIDRATNRRCWYLGALGHSAHRDASAKRHTTTKWRSRTRDEDDEEEERPVAKVSKPEPRKEVAARKDVIGGEVFAAVMPRQKLSAGPLDGEPATEVARPAVDIVAEQPDDMPLVWPVLTAAELDKYSRPPNVAASARLADAKTMPQHLPLLFLGALALAAVVGRGVASKLLRMRI
jgi:hypothetical protein